MINHSFTSDGEFYNKNDIAKMAEHFLTESAKTNSRERFLIFLGAGASADSDIDSANKMIKKFIDEICQEECPDLNDKDEKEDWVKSYYQDEEDKYSSLFEKCYRTEIERRKEIVRIVEKKDPSIGYIILAHLIKEQFVDTIITTNFDDLVYQACTTHTNIRPTVFSLGGFSSEINFKSDHPKVLKIHGDFMFSKLANTRKELKKPDPNMKRQVIQMFSDYKGVIVIGYAGNDKSIRRLFERLPKNKYLFWCHYQNEENPDPEKDKVNEKLTFLDKNLYDKKRAVIPISGFDKLMIEICNYAGITNEKIISKSIERFKKFSGSFRDFGLNQIDDTSSEKEKIENSLDRQYDKIGRSFDAVQYFILGDKEYLNKKYEEAKKFYLKAQKKKKNEADAYYNYAKVLSKHPRHYKKAKKIFERAINLNPEDNYAKNRLANLLVKLNRDDEAESIYKQVLDKNDNHFFANFEYGNLFAKRGQYISAEKYYRKAIKIDSKNVEANAEAHYKLGILFLGDPSKKDEAREQFEKAYRLKPDFAAAYFQLHFLFIADPQYRKKLNIREKSLLYKNQFYAFSLKAAIDLKMSGNSTSKTFIKIAKRYYKDFFRTDLYKKAQIEFLQDNNSSGLKTLKSAVQKNPSYKNLAKWDLSMRWIHKDPEFRKIIKEEVK